MQLLGVIVEERGSLYIVTEYMAKVGHKFSTVSFFCLYIFEFLEQCWTFTKCCELNVPFECLRNENGSS